MTYTLIILGLLCALCVVLPRKYDPAIRLKEWVMLQMKIRLALIQLLVFSLLAAALLVMAFVARGHALEVPRPELRVAGADQGPSVAGDERPLRCVAQGTATMIDGSLLL